MAQAAPPLPEPAERYLAHLRAERQLAGRTLALYTDALTRLVLSPDLRQRMGERAAVYAQNYRWEKITPRIVYLYQEVLTGKNPTSGSNGEATF